MIQPVVNSYYQNTPLMHTLEKTQIVPASLEETWAFFSSPHNLSKITPPRMGFKVLNNLPERMYEGLFIHYKVRPMLGIPVNWTTEITHIREGEFFVDEQRVGPYRIWHHQHHFREVAGGVECTDIVNYKLPMGVLGRWMEPLLVAPKLREIFEFRKKKIEEIFGKYNPTEARFERKESLVRN